MLAEQSKNGWKSDESAVSLVFSLVIFMVIIGVIINNHCSNRVRLPVTLAVGKIIAWYCREKTKTV